MKGLAVGAAVLVGALLGAVGHAALTRPAPREPAAPVARSAAPAVVACSASLAPADLAALATELAALIDERLGTPGGQPRPPAAAPRPEEPSPEAVAALASANQVLDAALAHGAWRDADRSAFRAVVAAMNGAQRGEAMSRLLTA